MLLAGCEQAPPPQFHLNMVAAVKSDTTPEYQQQIADTLAAMFGTPDAPFVMPETGLNQSRLELAANAPWSDEAGVSHGLYRRHCVHCHGITGDGHGPTARFLDPYPRDYRKGIFKFKSTYNAAKPTDADLHRVLWNGAPGTSMPSFSLLPEAEIESLVEYVKYLAIRGEMEQALISYAYDLGEEDVTDENGDPVLREDGEPETRLVALDPAQKPDQASDIKSLLEEVVAPWQEAKDNVIQQTEDEIPKVDRSPEEIAESINKGRELFYGEKANCIKCHGPTALGDGQQNDWDVWNKENNEFVNETTSLAKSIADREDKGPGKDEDAESFNQMIEDDEASLAAREPVVDSLYPIRNAIPRNLRKGVYRGGRRRIDLFHRIHAGIAGTPMPGLGAASAGGQGTLTDAQLWNIVDYLMSLPYEPPSQPQQTLQTNAQPVTQ